MKVLQKCYCKLASSSLHQWPHSFENELGGGGQKFNSFPAKFKYIHKAYVNLYELFILGVNIKYIVFSVLYRHINVPMTFKELNPEYILEIQ